MERRLSRVHRSHSHTVPRTSACRLQPIGSDLGAIVPQVIHTGRCSFPAMGSRYTSMRWNPGRTRAVQPVALSLQLADQRRTEEP